MQRLGVYLLAVSAVLLMQCQTAGPSSQQETIFFYGQVKGAVEKQLHITTSMGKEETVLGRDGRFSYTVYTDTPTTTTFQNSGQSVELFGYPGDSIFVEFAIKDMEPMLYISEAFGSASLLKVR